MTIITRSMNAILSLLCVLLTAASVSAQTKLFVTLHGHAFCNNCEPEYALEIDVDNGRIVDQSLIRDANGGVTAATTADGRYLVWTGKEGLGPFTLSALDTVTNTMVVSTPFAGEGLGVYAHPTKTRVFVSNGTSVFALEPERQQTFSPGCAPSTFVQLTGVSRTGQRLFVACQVGLGFNGETRVLDSETGALLSTIPNMPALQTPNTDGTEVFYFQSFPRTVLTRRDALTGALLAERDVTTFEVSAFSMSVDPVTGRVFLVGTIAPPAFANQLTIFEPADFAFVSRLVAPNVGVAPQIVKPVFSDDGRAFWATPIPFGNQFGTRISVFDTVNAVRVATADIPTQGSPIGPAGAAIALKPAAPTNVSSSVAGQWVTVRWNAGAGPAPTAYVLEVGLSPGVTHLKIDVPSGATQYSASGAASGTYYVRVRSINAGGALSTPSAEIQVVLP